MRYPRDCGWVWCLAAAGTLLVVGCCRSRACARPARGSVPLPPPPVLELNSGASEVPLRLVPLPGERVSAYGPADRVSVAPAGSAGMSRDMRYSQPLAPRLQPVPAPTTSAPLREETAHGTSEFSPAFEPPLPPVPSVRPNGRQRSDSSAAAPPPQAQPPRGPALGGEAVPGIARYWVIESDKNIATGAQPGLEGIGWLKARGFHTVLNLMPADESDPAEPSEMRRLDMDYIALPITAETITLENVEAFNTIADNGEIRPLFIQDSDGSRAGALWYLHRVLVDGVSGDEARREANRIGLKDTQTDFWLAIDRLLARAKGDSDR